ncbi:hypothetical protein [Methylocella silvestris]|uniref:hypothetical protein n=1 Tax=Methylocella silvestris TaxID=199596 RepID=UPI0011D0850B|nr:hypothetical protein [Methylocella silvestris]
MTTTAGLALLCATVPLAVTAPAFAAEAVDPTAIGPLAVTYGDYKLPAVVDPLVDDTVATELWARVYRPVKISGKHNFIIMLHGNHSTCGHMVDGRAGRVDDSSQYTIDGTCPAGYVVAPSHLGYAYVAERLASWGYIVISLNVNRGINAASGTSADSGLNMRRGRMVLRHLQQLAKWNNRGGAPKTLGFNMMGKLDFAHIGLMGHSRGGEGVLAAYNLYNDPDSPWPKLIGPKAHFDAMFELAPVDGQTNRSFYAYNVPWSVLLPMCDGDVSNLAGVKVFDRTLRSLGETVPYPKASYTVWGTNHNYYNTEWQTSDSTGCNGDGNVALFDPAQAGSANQRTAGLYAMMAMFRGHLGKKPDASFAQLFNPDYTLPFQLSRITTITRGFSNYAVAQQAYPLSSTGTLSNATATYTSLISQLLPNHDPTVVAGLVNWPADPANPATSYFQASWSPTGQFITKQYKTVEMRVSLQCADGTVITASGCSIGPNAANANGTTDFNIAAVLSDGTLSQSVPLSKYVSVRGPVGGPRTNLFHPILQTVRVPLADLGLPADATVKKDSTGPLLKAIRLTFNAPTARTGAIYLTGITLTDLVATKARGSALVAMESESMEEPAPLTPVMNNGAVITEPPAVILPAGSVSSVSYTPTVTSAFAPKTQTPPPAKKVQLTLTSPVPVEVKDSLLTLDIGGKTFVEGGYGPHGDLKTVVFTVDPTDFAALPDQAQILLKNGSTHQSYGALKKGLLKK